MKKLRYLFFMSFVASLLVSCDETVNTNTNPGEPPVGEGRYSISRITESLFSEEDTIELETRFEYELGRLDEVIAPEYTLRFHYANMTKVTSVDHYAGGVFQFTSEFHYNDDNELLEIVSYDIDIPEKTEFVYEGGKMSEVRYKTLINNGWTTQMTSKFTYSGANVAERLDIIGTGPDALQGKTVYGIDDSLNPYRFLNKNIQKFFMQFDSVNPLNLNNVTSEDLFFPIDSEEPTDAYTYDVTGDNLDRAVKIRKKNVADDYVETERNFEYQ